MSSFDLYATIHLSYGPENTNRFIIHSPLFQETNSVSIMFYTNFKSYSFGCPFFSFTPINDSFYQDSDNDHRATTGQCNAEFLVATEER